MVARGTLVHIGCGLAVIEDGAGDKKKTFTLGDFGFDVYFQKVESDPLRLFIAFISTV